MSLRVKFAGLDLENPFILAAAPPTDELEIVRNGLRQGWAGAVLKTTHMDHDAIDLSYPIVIGLDFEDKKALGLGNIDWISKYPISVIEKRVAVLKDEFPDKAIIVSIMTSGKDDWMELTARVRDAGADAVEVATCCPQGSVGYAANFLLSWDVEGTREMTSWVKEAAGSMPVLIKVSSQTSSIVPVATAVRDGGADAITAARGGQVVMGIDLDTFVPHPNVEGKSTFAGYTSPAIKPISLKMIADVAQNVPGLTISGIGGVNTWRDAAEMILLGASTVQVAGAVMKNGFRIIQDLCEGLEDLLENKGMESPADLRGLSLPHLVKRDGMVRHNRIKSSIDRGKCTRCDVCYVSCQDGGHMAITLDKDRYPVIDEDVCVGCGLCRVVCPVAGCVTLRPAEPGTMAKAG